MPDVLATLPESDRDRAAEELTHFLVSVQPAGDPAPAASDEALVRVGRDLYHSLGCVACHAPTEPAADAPAGGLAAAASNATPLSDLGRKFFAGELAAFLRDPALYHPAGRMPSLGLTQSEAGALAIFLTRDQLKEPPLDGGPRQVPGMDVAVYEGDFGSCRDIAKSAPVAKTTATEITPVPAGDRKSNFGLRFTGSLAVPTTGEYTFETRSDDGTLLSIDGKVVVNNDQVHPATTRSGKVTLDAGAHAFELWYFQGGGEIELAAQWQGPGFKRTKLGGDAITHAGSPLHPVGYARFAVDPAKAAAGRDWFEKLNCVACHGLDLPGGQTPPRAIQADKLDVAAGSPDKGCLGDTPSGQAPRFSLTAEQRAALRATLREVAKLDAPPTPAEEVQWTMTRLNCFACHSRDAVGGPADSGKSPWFAIVGNADLGEEGKIPPHLNGVGAKLKRTWLDHVLKDGAKVRPYMAARMPVFPQAATGRLAALFETADARPDMQAAPAVTSTDAKWGRKLVGRDGLSCIACHTFDKFASLGIPALGLDMMAERLRWDWFRRYLPDPAALRPGTRMPSFFPDGKAVNTAILGGDKDAQIKAIWAWLCDGAKADIPDGLIRASKEIVVGNEAVIYRNFIEGAGSRAIGVGYPEHVNLAWDANNLRLALIWQGAFIDAARHSTDRGVGFEPPLGDHVVKMAEGAPLAVLDDPQAAWPSLSGKKAGYQFLGYALDDTRRPAFRFRFGGVEVEDFSAAKVNGVDASLERRLTFKGSGGPNLWFRAATGEIKALNDGSFEVDGKWRIRIKTGGPPVVAGREIRVRIASPGVVVEEITW
jgi:mono/diheme cytochrome c family protein